uniref:ELMO domain-containing protein n=1 Tax=Oryza meridionalis TaxID=40149 RepID=A0A0E0F5S1_9ORYZ
MEAAAAAAAAAEAHHHHNLHGCLAVRAPVPRCSLGGGGGGGAAAMGGSSDEASCGSPRWIGKSLSCVCIKRKGAYERICMNLTPVQEERLQRLRHRMKVYFDPSRRDHQIKSCITINELLSFGIDGTDLTRVPQSYMETCILDEALKALWHATYPDQELQGLISEQWKDMGWQGRDPSTDFRGAGFISLENLLFFAKTFSASFQRLLKKQCGNRATWEYPFAVAGVNITFMIMQMLDLQSKDEWAFDLLYCVAFVVMDKQWLDKNASYMDFNEILKSTRTQLERELLLDDVMRIEDMPSYSLLC